MLIGKNCQWGGSFEIDQNEFSIVHEILGEFGVDLIWLSTIFSKVFIFSWTLIFFLLIIYQIIYSYVTSNLLLWSSSISSSSYSAIGGTQGI